MGGGKDSEGRQSSRGRQGNVGRQGTGGRAVGRRQWEGGQWARGQLEGRQKLETKMIRCRSYFEAWPIVIIFKKYER